MTLQERLRLCIGRDRLDDDDQVALVPRWTVKEAADELDRLQAENEALRAAVSAERERLTRNVADLHMAQSVNNQNYPSAWHDGVDAALDAMQEQKL